MAAMGQKLPSCYSIMSSACHATTLPRPNGIASQLPRINALQDLGVLVLLLFVDLVASVYRTWDSDG